MQSHEFELQLDSVLSSKGLTPLEYTIRFVSWEDLFESDQWKEIFRGYQISEMWNRQTAYQKYEFIGAYLVPVDPATNYGKSFEIYVQYFVEGIRHLQKVSVTTALTNSNLVIF